MELVDDDARLAPTPADAASARAWLAQYGASTPAAAALFNILGPAAGTPVANQTNTFLRGIFANPALHLTAAEAAARVMAGCRLAYCLLERECRLALAAGATLPDLPALLAASRRLGPACLVVCAEVVAFAMDGEPGTGAGAVCKFPALVVEAGLLPAAPWVWDAARSVALAAAEAGAPPGLLRTLAYMRARCEEELAWGPGSEVFALIEAARARGGHGDGGWERARTSAAGDDALSALPPGPPRIADGTDLPAWRGSVWDGPVPLEPAGLAGTASGPSRLGAATTTRSATAAPPPPRCRLQTAAQSAVEAECVLADLLTMAAWRLEVRTAAAARHLVAARSAERGHTPLPAGFVGACALLAGHVAAAHVELLFGQHASSIVAAIIYGAARAFNVAVPLKLAAAASQLAAPHVWPDQVLSATAAALGAGSRGGASPSAAVVPDAAVHAWSGDQTKLKDFYDGPFLDVMADELRRRASTAALAATPVPPAPTGRGRGRGRPRSADRKEGAALPFLTPAFADAAEKAALAKARAGRASARAAARADERASASDAEEEAYGHEAAGAPPPVPSAPAVTTKRTSGKRAAKAAPPAAAPPAKGAAAGDRRGLASRVGADLQQERDRAVAAAGGAAPPAAAAAPRLPLKALTAKDIANRGNAPPGPKRG